MSVEQAQWSAIASQEISSAQLTIGGVGNPSEGEATHGSAKREDASSCSSARRAHASDHMRRGLSEKDDQDDKDGQTSPALKLVDDLVSEQGDGEGDDGNDDDSRCLGDLVCSWDCTEG